MSFVTLPTAIDAGSMLPSSRAEAKRTGKKAYFNGIPCPKGHLSARKMNSGGCVECARLNCIKWNAENTNRVKAYRDAYYIATVERRKEVAREWQAKNPERKRDNGRKWDAANQEQKNDNLRRWRTNNPDKVRAINQRSYANNTESHKVCYKKWRIKNPDKITALSQKRRSRLADGDGVTADIIATLKKLQRFCVDCKRKFGPELKATLDHIMPLAKGGRHERANVELRCKSCNSRKHDKDPIEHAQSLGRLL